MKRGLLAGMLLVWFGLAPIFGGETPKTAVEGLKVRGHWKIEVFNPDGEKVSSKEFENALVGPGFLIGVMSGLASLGGMYVVINAASGGTGPCNSSDCKIIPNGMGITGADSTNLVYVTTGANNETMDFSGSVTVDTNSTIGLVETWFAGCADVKPTDCFNAPTVETVFTRKTLTTGVTVTAGQIVQISVQLTFS